MLIKREGSFAVGCWNALLISLLTGLLLLFLWWAANYVLGGEEPDPEAVTVEITHPVTGEVSEECLVLLPAEVSEEPDYRIGRGEECEEAQ